MQLLQDSLKIKGQPNFEWLCISTIMSWLDKLNIYWWALKWFFFWRKLPAETSSELLEQAIAWITGNMLHLGSLKHQGLKYDLHNSLHVWQTWSSGQHAELSIERFGSSSIRQGRNLLRDLCLLTPLAYKSSN